MTPLARARVGAAGEPALRHDTQAHTATEQRDQRVVEAACCAVPMLGPGLHLGAVLREHRLIDVA